MPIGVRADPALAERASRLLRLGLLLSGVGASCTPSAGSPIELGPASNGESDAGISNECSARDQPILYRTRGVGASELEVQLYVIRADGSGNKLIARGSAYTSAVWAPDGRSIAFRERSPTSISTGLSAIGMMASDGTEQVVLFTDQLPIASGTSFGVTWAPDGQTIVFASPRDTMGSALWVLSRFGGEPRLFMPDVPTPQFDPAWSPREPNRIAYSVAEGNGDIWQVDASGAADPENVTGGRALHPRLPRWSPDGQQLAFTAEDPRPEAEGGGDLEIYVWTASTRDIVRVTDNEDTDTSPVWSPDGNSLLVTSYRLPDGAPPASIRRNTLWLVPLDSTDPPRPLRGTFGEISGSDWYWSDSCGTAP